MPAIFSARAARRRGRHPRRRQHRDQEDAASQGGCPGSPRRPLLRLWELLTQLPLFTCCGGGRNRDNTEDADDGWDATNGRGYPNGQQRAGPDVAAFASLGADAWGSTSTGATAVAAAPVRPQAGPQQPQVAPQQAGPHHATEQPTLTQGQEAMSSAGVGMAGGGGNHLRCMESPGLTAGTGVATGAADQVDSSSVSGSEDRSLGAGKDTRDEFPPNAAKKRSSSKAAFKLNPAAPEWRPASHAASYGPTASIKDATNGRGYPNGQQRAGPDVAAFASLGADAWGSTSTGATAVAAAPVRPQAGPQQPQVAPQQAGSHHATEQPTLTQGQEAMSSAEVGMAGGGGNHLRGMESPGLTAGMGVATGAAEQAGGNSFDMFLQET